MLVTRKMIREARIVYVFVSFTGNDESWIPVSKANILVQLSYVPGMTGEMDQNRDLWIAKE